MRSMLCGAMIVVMAMIVGCGDDGPKVYKVTGTITIDGAPVPENTTISFIPVKPTGMQAAAATTDAAGKYTLSSPANPKKAGALPGEYMVAIHNKVPDDNLTEEEREAKRQTELENGGMVSAPKVKDLLPKMYANASSSGLKATVAENDENVFNVDLGTHAGLTPCTSCGK